MMGKELYLARYTPVGDLTVVTVCLVMIAMMLFSYVRRSRSFGIFVSIVGMIVLASYADVVFYALAASPNPALYNVAYAVRCVYHALLFTIFRLYVSYIAEVTHMDKAERRPYVTVAWALFTLVTAADVTSTIAGHGIRIGVNTVTYRGADIFIYGYSAYIALIVVMMVKVRKRLYRRVMLGFYATMALSFLVLLIQGIFNQSSYTVATFFYPVIAMFYFMHSTPYDAQIGAIDSRALEDMVRYNRDKGRDFVFMSLYLRDFDEEGKTFPEDMQATIRRFSVDFFKDATLFRVSGGHIILIFQKRRNPDYESQIVRILGAFRYEHQRFKRDYKIVIGQSIEEISRKNEYVSFIRNIQRGMEENSVHRVTEADVQQFNRSDLILHQLEDIYKKRDLDDPRVLAYCQPVYNLSTRKYDTAEALMRLRLDGLGLVFPDQFIPLAEENGFIHVLTLIILRKTCAQVRSLLEQGYEVTRVSVNVSVPEMKDDAFCEDITRIIDDSGIPGEKIAIELTESRSDADFIVMQDKIAELRKRGIKFYLDDFGTGYSNMERIMELPFDIIKFDRSMVLASGVSERSRTIVNSLATMFARLNYAVLYEGVEGDSDETMCAEMCASYLQGYKYSRPVPIETLTQFFDKAGEGK